MRNGATKASRKGAMSPEERRERLLQTLEDWAAPPLYVLLAYIVPFAIPFAALHFLGAPWWVSVPLSLVLMPLLRTILLGPPCRCHRHRGKRS